LSGRNPGQDPKKYLWGEGVAQQTALSPTTGAQDTEHEAQRRREEGGEQSTVC
jgi:hypothetical protein